MKFGGFLCFVVTIIATINGIMVAIVINVLIQSLVNAMVYALANKKEENLKNTFFVLKGKFT